jgi:hypothetical protein
MRPTHPWRLRVRVWPPVVVVVVEAVLHCAVVLR